MVVLGIDPGTALTGYGFIDVSDRGDLTVVDYGVISTPAKQKMEYRLLTLFEELQAKILLHKPVYGAVEKLFFSNNVTTAISVGQARDAGLGLILTRLQIIVENIIRVVGSNKALDGQSHLVTKQG